MKLGFRQPEHKKLSMLDDLRLVNLCTEIERLVEARDTDRLREALLPLVKGVKSPRRT